MKKIMTRLLSLALICAFVPSFVLADTWDLEKGDITVNATDTSQTVTQVNGEAKVDASPVITSNGTATDHTITINAASGAKANVTLENVNIDVSNEGKAAITAQGSGNVNIELNGTNTVVSGKAHAGVEKNNEGNLTIADKDNNGSLNATGGKFGAGIGGGNKGAGTDITISGGEVSATGGEYGAGIGGGCSGAGTNITVSGGEVSTTGGENGAGIGGGYGGAGTNITVSGGEVSATGGAYGAGIGGGETGAGEKITVSGGKVIAQGGKNGAGIGGGKGNFRNEGNGKDIKVIGGEVFAKGGMAAAGIGGGAMSDGTQIIVSGGKVTAEGNKHGAGIGGGINGDGNQITISGGEVSATGGAYGAGIGGGSDDHGNKGNGNDIKVSGGTVKAQGGENGAGIGGGKGGNGTDIGITNGKVTATGGDSGAGIGGGHYGAGTDITVSGGEVTAKGGDSGAGIGGGLGGSGTDVTVSNDAQVKVQGGEKYESVGAGAGAGAGIGDGGKPGQDGAELPQKPDQLKEGTIQYYAPGADMQTDAPTKILYNPDGNHSWDGGTVTSPATCTTPGVKTYTCLTNPAHTKTEELPALGHLFETYVYNNDATYEKDGTETAKCERCDETDTRTVKGSKLTGNTAETAVDARQEAYWVSGTDGRSLPHQSQVKDGVLTVTVQADTASLRGTTGSLRQLEAQGITGIRFVTNKAQSDFTLSDLLTSGTGSVTLTHDGDKVTFTLESKDISGILK